MKRIVALVCAIAVSVGVVGFTAASAEAHTKQVSSTCENLSVNLANYQATQTTADQWWNWSPNKDQGPFDGPPSFPTDHRGTWQGPHNNGGPDQEKYGTFNSSNGESGRASWFHREQGETKTNHVTVTIDGVVVDDVDFSTSFVKTYVWSSAENHTYTVAVTAYDDPTGSHGWTFTQSGSQNACVVNDATAGVNVIAPDCATDGSAQITGLANASLEGDLDISVGTHNAHFVADSGHRFADGSETKDVEYTVAGATDDCPVVLTNDARAAVKVVPPSCDTKGSVSVARLVNASLLGNLPQSVGRHTAYFVADFGHAFASGKQIVGKPYRVKGATGDCTQPPQHHSNPPKHNNPPKATPHTPTVIAAGLSGDNADSMSAGEVLVWFSIGFFGTLILFGIGATSVVLVRRRETEK